MNCSTFFLLFNFYNWKINSQNMVFDVSLAFFWESRSESCTFYISKVPFHTEFCSDILFGMVRWLYLLILPIDITTGKKVSYFQSRAGGWYVSCKFRCCNFPLCRQTSVLNGYSQIERFRQGFWGRHCWCEQRWVIERGGWLPTDHGVLWASKLCESTQLNSHAFSRTSVNDLLVG